MTNILDLLGRILISALFFINGIFKTSNYDGTVDWMENFGLPGFLIIPAIILEIIGSQKLKLPTNDKSKKYYAKQISFYGKNANTW